MKKNGKNQKRNLLLIQPHSDDILFSASNFLFNRNQYDKVVLYTVENSEKRIAEDEQLCEFFNMKQITGKLLEDDKSYYHYYNILKNTVFDYQKSDECLLDYKGKKFLKSLKKEIQNIVSEYQSKNYEIIVCLGIGHPMHYFVRKSVLETVPDSLLYRDFPHSYKRKTQKCFEETQFQFKLKKEEPRTEEDNKAKFEIAYNVYKTQRSLLWFEKGYIDKNLPEQLYVKIK